MSHAEVLVGKGCMFPLSANTEQTLLDLSLRCKNSRLRVSPLCAEHPEGQRDVRGWVLDLPHSAPATALPFGCSMFDGVSVVRCDCTEKEILSLLSDETETRRRLGAAVQELLQATASKPQLRASWKRCHPSANNGHPKSLMNAIVSTHSASSKVSFFQPQNCDPVLDSEAWEPELSQEGFVGIFHHWHGSDVRDRRLCLYLACHSYLPRAALEIADMVRGLHEADKVMDVCQSEELHWLRTASSRNRARILAHVCRKMGLSFPSMSDYHASSTGGGTMAICTTETLHNDIHATPCGRFVRVLNHCSDTSRSFNGAVCVMAPWDGMWIFHGNAARAGDFGAPYGAHFLPTASPRLPPSIGDAAVSTADPLRCRMLQVWSNSEEALAETCAVMVPAALPPIICAEKDDDQTIDRDVLDAYRRSLARHQNATTIMLPHFPGVGRTRSYAHFDENTLQAMTKHGWNRAHGYTALIPIACALVEFAPSS